MYWHMTKEDRHLLVERGVALHKIIRLLTASTMNGGYLNFMGNEFGHPEWIDFPREGNGWSYKYARRQWSLVNNPNLKYRQLYLFDQAMIKLLKSTNNLLSKGPLQRCINDGDQVLAYQRGDLLFVFNLHPTRSYTDYGILVDKGMYKVILSTDAPAFGGYGTIDERVEHFTLSGPEKNAELEWLPLYLPARTGQVLKKQ